MRARKGEISTRELVRRSRAASADRATKEREEHERERMQASQEVCTAICDWLASDGFSGAYGEQIVNEARRLLANAEENGQLPPQPPAPPGTPIEAIIERLRPPRLVDDGTVPLAWYAVWLMRWVYFALPDSFSRHQALGLALDKQIRR